MNQTDPVWEEVTAFLQRPDSYDPPADRVERLDTHISRLFFTGDRVYKLKRPQRLPFLDARDLERRRFFCEEELRLNRRLAGNVYLRVVPITRNSTGTLELGGAGTAVEYAVEMKRLPAERMLDAMLDRGEVDHEILRRLVDTLVQFHSEADAGAAVTARGRPELIESIVVENLDEIGDQLAAGGDSPPLTPELHSGLRQRATSFLEQHRDLFLRRVEEQRIRDGHGDLHSGNICFLPDRLVIYDCIEFEPAFRQVDVAYDLAFLGMDLAFKGFVAFAHHLARVYAGRSGDQDFLALQPFYRAHLACVRGKVHWIQARQQDAGSPAAASHRRTAARYFQVAAAAWLPPALILTCGLPASGKSFVARHLARPLEAHLLRSDVVRKQLAGIPPTEHAEIPGLYGRSMSERTYAALLEEAREELERGRSVIVDATFIRSEQRAPFETAAALAGVPLVLVHCHASEATTRQRMAERKGDAAEVSDADLAVYRELRRAFEPPDELAEARIVVCRSPEPPEATTNRVLGRLLELTAPTTPQ